MICNNLDDFKNNLKNNKRIIGLDIGKKTIGIALSDRDKNIATPKFIIRRKNIIEDIKILTTYIIDNDVCAIVSGLPLNSKEENINSCNYINKFIDKLDEKINLPILFSNEFLTSFAAEDFLIDEMKTSYKKTKNIVDKVAAAIILQEILNKINK